MQCPYECPQTGMNSPGQAERRFFGEVFAATDRALTGPETSSFHLDVTGVPVVVEFASTKLRELLMPALRHLVESSQTARTPQVRLSVWDSAATAVAMPPPPVPRDAFTRRGEPRGFAGNRCLVASDASEYSVSALDRDEGRGVYWVQDAQNLPYTSRSAPLRTLLHWILMDRGRHLVHGAAVGDERSGVLLVGTGGIGKSTTALRCLAAGMRFLGDDWLAFAADPPRAYTLYSVAKLFSAEPRPAGVPLPSSAADDAKVVLALDDYSHLIPRELPIRTLATLCFTDGQASIVEDIDPSTLFQAAVVTTLAKLPHSGPALLRLMGDFRAQVANVRVKLGRDPDLVVSAMRDIAADARLSRRASPAGHEKSLRGLPVNIKSDRRD